MSIVDAGLEDESRPHKPSAYLLTWKEERWDYKNINEMLKSFKRQGYVDQPWRIASFRMAKPGHRVWLLKQGKGHKGIFGAGVIIESARDGDIGNGKLRPMVRVRFHRLVDPRRQFLIEEDQVREILDPNQIHAQASGCSLTEAQANQLSELAPPSAEVTPFLNDLDADEDVPLSDERDARERIRRSIILRRGQRAFRQALITAYDGKCAMSGCNVLDVLEAAHIRPYLGPSTNDVRNGLLLRADLHTLFDLGLVSVKPDTLTITVAKRLHGSPYEALCSRKLRRPRNRLEWPSKTYLRWHHEHVYRQWRTQRMHDDNVWDLPKACSTTSNRT